MMKTSVACTVVALSLVDAFAAPLLETVENDHFRMVVDPMGGRVKSLLSKDIGVDLAVPDSGGLFTESSWDRWKSRGKLAETPFVMNAQSRNGAIEVDATGQTSAGYIPFLRVEKHYRSVRKSTALSVEYNFINAPDAMSLQAYAPSVHMQLAIKDRIVSFFWAGDTGIRGVRQNAQSSLRCDKPTRGWFAMVDTEGEVGAVLTFPLREYSGFGTWLPGVPQTELKFIPVGIENGAGFRIDMELVPFKGLAFVSGAGGGLVGSLGGGTCKVVNSRAGRIVAVHDGRETVLDFDRPGALRAFETKASFVRLVNGGRDVCRLDAKPSSGPWCLEPECSRREPFNSQADLSCFTNFPSFGLRSWGKPLAGGPVKVSIVSGRGNQIEIGALAECFDMDYRTIGVEMTLSGNQRSLGNPMYSYGDVFGRIGPQDREREVNKVLSRDSDVILLGGVPLDALPESSRKIVAERVKGGAGLVLVGNDEHDTTDFGDGRVVRLQYPAMTRIGPWLMAALAPDISDFYPDHAPDLEAYYSRVAKAIMEAAGRKLDPSATGDIDWVVYNDFREKLAEGRGGLPSAESLPKFSGTLSLEYSVRRNGKVLFWDRRALTNAPPAAIASLTPTSQLRLKEGDVVPVVVRVSGAPSGMEAEIRFVDVHGRVLDRRRMPAASEMKVDFKAVNDLRSRSYMVVAELLSGGTVVSRRRERYIARPSREKLEWNDFEIALCGNSETRYYLFPYLAKAYKDAQFVSVSGQWPVRYTLSPFYDFNTSDSTHIGLNRQSEPPEYAKTGDKMKLVRSQCVSDPKRLEATEKFLEKAFARDLPTMGYRHHGFGDEQSLTGHEGTPIDYCFSEHCLREFRVFARARYGTLERLNAAYDSSFKTWDEVVPFTRQEVWAANGGHVAGWSDHLEFMDDRVTNVMTRAARVLKRLDPDIRLTLSGTQPPAAYSGMDWWKILQVLDGAQSYYIGGQYDIHRSFRPDGRFAPWSIGYSSRGDTARRSLWETVFRGQSGVSFWWARSGINPDLTLTHGISDILPDLKRIGRGVGKYVMNFIQPRHEIAILYSQASYRGAFIEKRGKELNALHEAVRQALRRLCVSFDYVSYDQLASGAVLERGYKALLLADAVAMSDKEIACVRSFAAAGGVVVSFGTPGTRRENCLPRQKAPLDGFFDGRKTIIADRGSDADAVCVVLRGALAKAGVATDTLKVFEVGGGAIHDAVVFAAEDSAGNQFRGVVTSCFGNRKVRYVFPRRGWTYDIVDGRAYGNVGEVSATYGKGCPHGFVQLDSPTGMKGLYVDGTRVRIDCGGKADTVVRVKVLRPDGSDAPCYAANLLARGGKATYNLPFALSDAKGTWTVRVGNVLGGASTSCSVVNGHAKNGN